MFAAPFIIAMTGLVKTKRGVAVCGIISWHLAKSFIVSNPVSTLVDLIDSAGLTVPHKQ